MKRISAFSILGFLIILALCLPGIPAPSAQAASAGYSLRFRGHGTNDIDRVKIRIDAPAVPADVGGNFTIEFWLKAFLADNTSGACVPGGDNWTHGNILVDRDVYGNGDYGDYGISLANGRIAFGVARGAAKNTI
ncbi:MAG: LamG domain-containing protein, partial [Planctomycetota bacterium]